MANIGKVQKASAAVALTIIAALVVLIASSA
ncbi:hypothetical protein GGD56_001789 [Rhizobium mongolense]|uniref:Uncharacterized protein n=1 Tax=Rhizobium mongolense TaxID=57676 RepID=A0ABR6IJC0_9HYPH|nr:hypothetical protein [Rhizobium mongolense]